MYILLWILIATWLLCLTVTPLMRLCAIRLGLVDNPDKRRKMHQQAIPLAGGLSVFVSSLIMLGAVYLLSDSLGLELNLTTLMGLGLVSIVICVVGGVDDLGKLRGRHKLLGQIFATLVVISFGVRVDQVQFFGFTLDLALLAVPFTMLLLLASINSLNLIDGMDGLLGSVGTIVCLTLAILAGLAGKWTEALVAVTLAGALLGFLRYNLPPASIFLGDCGSMLVGLAVGTLAIQSSLKSPTTVVLAAPIVLLTLPLFDTTAAIIRRRLTGRSIYSTDRGHLHHCLMRRGMSTRRILTVVSLCCIVTGCGVLASRAFNSDIYAILTASAVVGILIVTGLFGYSEAMLIKHRVATLGLSLFRSWHRHPVRVSEVRLQGSLDWNPLWKSLTENAAELKLNQLCLDVNAPALHEGYHARWEASNGPTSELPKIWHVEIPLTAGEVDVGRIKIAGYPDERPIWEKLALITGIMEDFTSSLVIAERRSEPKTESAAEPVHVEA